MNIEKLRKLCLSFSHATEEVKWGNDLCFCVGKKMFCVTGLSGNFKVCLKVNDVEFAELSASQGIIPAPYLARYNWILVENDSRFSEREWEHYIRQSYELVWAGLPKKVAETLV